MRRRDAGRIGGDDHNTWTLQGNAGAIRLRDWSTADRLVDGVWQADGGNDPA
jgi:hypothetical protein